MVKVVTDLVLPLYTSQIVNVGINGGIDSAIPIALTEETFTALEEHFEDKELLRAAYRYDADQGGYFLINHPQIGEEAMEEALAKIRITDPEGFVNRRPTSRFEMSIWS